MPKAHSILVESLHNPAIYPHPVDRVKLVETHISWVFLAGDFAYKLKKPVNFGFLDFSTLSKRQHFCAEELRLNRRFAPQLYLDVISIGGTDGSPLLGSSPAIDYLVKMKRFPRENELDLLLERNQLTSEMIEFFADDLAALHQHAPRVEQALPFGSPAAILEPIEENFRQIKPLLPDAPHQAQLERLENWASSRHKQLSKLIKQRKAAGYIRECHGDVHLANMVCLDQRPVLFDCIEFNKNLRCIDPVSDYAFLLMDLDDRGATNLSWTFLNRYLQQSGDYQGLPLLNFYKCYRAMVRAKVTCLRLNQSGLNDAERKADRKLLQSYLDLAESYNQKQNRPLLICHGFSGSGKSSFIKQLAPLCEAVTIHSDIERKRLHGLEPTECSSSRIAAGIYSENAGLQTYQRLLKLAKGIIESGFAVIVDATFLKRNQRKQMQRLAAELNRPFSILDFPLPESELMRRVEQRATRSGEISEATPAVLHQQLAQAEPLSNTEKELCIKIFPDTPPEEITRRLA